MTRLVQYALTAIVLSAPAYAQQSGGDDRARYADCMAQVETRPKAAFDVATAWEGLSGGHPARHCALAALVALGHYNEAAQGLEKLAQQVRADAPFKASLLIQASSAWMAADDATRARAVANTALELLPETPDALVVRGLIVRARALALLGAYWEAADDLSRVLYAQPKNAEALVLRGAAYRQLDAAELALDDLNRALAITPHHPEGLLERGIVHRLMGNKAAARSDWRALVQADPTSEAARRGEVNLHALDSGLD